MESWDDLVREPQNRAIKLIKENIKPGKPLMVLGLPGCGKYEMTLRAVANLGLHQCSCHIMAFWDEPGVEYEQFLRSIPGNGVLIFHGIDHASPSWMEKFLLAINNPDLPVVFVGDGSRNPSLILAMQCKVLKFTNDFPAELLEIN